MIGVTGCTGFIGSHLGTALTAGDVPWLALARRSTFFPRCRVVDFGSLSAVTEACAGVDVLFHCAGHAHAFRALGIDETLHREINFETARRVAEAAGRAGVKRFVFLSSVKAMADPGAACVDEDFPGQPETAYGQAKRAAEAAVLEAGRRFGMHVVILRLAMVYGSGGRGNLERMGRLVQRGIFPPLPETGNHRSMVHVDDVVAVMRQVADDDRANGRTYIVASPEAPSGRELYNALREALGKPPYTWEVPELALWLGAQMGNGLEAISRRRLPFSSEALARLLGSAWYSPARIERELGWRAKISLADGLREMFGGVTQPL